MTIVILSGAGISAESGIKTFRDSGGLWEDHEIMDVASIQGWHKNQALVLDFYNKRRQQLKDVKPNKAHYALAELEEYHDLTIITQNVDDLHERAGSKNVLHLHGELNKVRSVVSDGPCYEWYKDLHIGDVAEDGHQMRPHIVWFGEAVPMLEKAISIVMGAEILIIIGTSLQVYPAAGLSGYVNNSCKIYYCDLNPELNFELQQNKNLQVIPGRAAKEVPLLVNTLINSV
ncbi:MAG: Sir2 family NAD-dependent protein deacetylase [Saprospiraceae bacterium]